MWFGRIYENRKAKGWANQLCCNYGLQGARLFKYSGFSTSHFAPSFSTTVQLLTFMKIPLMAGLLFSTILNIQAQIGGSVSGTNQSIPSSAQDTPYSVVQRSANSRVWERTTYDQRPPGGTVSHVHHYTELATGLHYLQNGHWLESKEEIDLLPQGGAAATRGRHQAYFPANIYQGSIELVTPDGLHLHSRPMGISYDDGRRTVLIAQLKDSIGELVGSNQVVYPDAFTDFKADLVCTYRRSGFESDVIFREQPHGPEQYGLNPQTSQLQLLTEFFDTPEPIQNGASVTNSDGLTDTTLQFGKTTMGHGKAFSIDQTNHNRLTLASTRVYKSWLHLNGRTFLVEQLPFHRIRGELQSLPVPASAPTTTVSLNSPLHKVSSSRLLVPNRPAREYVGSAVQLARARVTQKPGVVLDYTTIDSDQDEFAFVSGETYLVDGEFNLTHTTTIEDGTIIKFDNDGQIDIDSAGTIFSPSSADTPAIFTSINDDSVGESMADSGDPYYTGAPSDGDMGVCLNINASSQVISNMCFYYASYPVQNWSAGSIDVWDCQFIATEICVSSFGNIGLHNILVNQTSLDWPIYLYAGSLIAENVTFDNVNPDYVVIYDEYDLPVFLTNCLFVSGSSVSLNGSSWSSSSGPVYQTAANANCYLTSGSPYRNVGTTNINPATLIALRAATTYAPQDGGYPDSDTPDLGYHYPLNEDSDHDGLPDWWEWAQLGDFSFSGNDIDYYGNTLLYDYQNGLYPWYPTAPTGMLGWWHFDNQNWSGAQGQVPLVKTNLQLVFGVVSNAVAMTNANNSLRYNVVESNGQTNLDLHYGSISFWFKPNWSSTNAGGTGPQNEGRLLEVGSEGSTGGWWGLVVGSAGTNLYFGTQTNSTSTLTTNLNSTIVWQSNEWHQIALTYSASSSCLYIDGQPAVTNGVGVTYYPGAVTRSQGFTIGSSGPGTNQVMGAFDELETFNYLLSTDDIESNYEAAATLDSDGNGIPDIWETTYFGHVGTDPYALDPSGDGWTYLDDFQKGFVPGTWHTPRPPQDISWHFDASGTNVVLAWDAAGGVVDHYEIDKGFDGGFFRELDEVDSNTLTFTTAVGDITDSYFSADDLQVTAVYANGDRSTSTYVAEGQLISLDRDCQFVRGKNGKFYLAIPNIPENLSRVHVSWPFPLSGPASFDIYSSNIVNGILQLPDDIQQLFVNSDYPIVQLVDTQGHYSENIWPSILSNEHDSYATIASTNFVNAPAQMKENLKFLLREAGVLWPFGYSSGLINAGGGYAQRTPAGDDANSPESALARGTASTNYEYYGYHTFSPVLGYSFMSELRPVQENFLWRNFVYNPIDYTNGAGGVEFDTAEYGYGIGWAAGVDNLGLSSGVDTVMWPTVNYCKYQYTGTGSETPLPLAFDSSNSGWIYHVPNLNNLGYVSGSIGIGIKNIYGLTLQSVYGNTNFALAGSDWPDGYYDFENYTVPDLQVVDYFFGSQTPFFNYTWYDGYSGPAPVLPGAPTFSNTNKSPLLVTSIGQPMTVSGWAKMAIANGDTNKFGYLEQYFTNAYSIDTNGNATTNLTGILSPYGDFFPTMPGPAALVTMPDIDTGERGTGIVNVIKLQLDVNHDGTMDLGFSGPDNTSAVRPFTFWINNDNDYSSTPVDSTNSPPISFDYGQDHEAINGGDGGQLWISSMRDLEDYARMWICGVPTLPAAQGYSATLSWNAISGNPSIKIFNATDADGGTNYLTNTNSALAQIVMSDGSPSGVNGPAFSIGAVSTNIGYSFPQNFFDGKQKHLLFEGVGTGKGELVFTIYQGTNIIAQTGQWIELHDIKDFYEQVVLTNNQTGAISNWTSSIQAVRPSELSLGNDTNLIVFVHGINVRPWDSLVDAETVLKRLYWAGYQGSFAEVKWPCNLLTPIPRPLTPTVFNASELQGYKAATAFATYLNTLHSRFSGFRLHLLVHSQGNAIASEALAQSNVSVDTYILTQAAIPDSCYDVNATDDVDLLAEEHPGNFTPDWQPWGYRGAYTNLTVRMANFHNPQDGVVQIWVSDQLYLKPSVFFDTSGYYYDGTNSHYAPFVGSGYVVTDPEESRSMVARSRSLALGLSGPESPSGVIQLAVDLHAEFNFSTAISEHSAQWTRPIQTSLPYYVQVLKSISP
jgi:hypothetical protein